MTILLMVCCLCQPLQVQRELIADPGFRTGFRVQSPVPGKVVYVGELTPTETEAEPVWRLAQWSSRLSIEGLAFSPIAPEVYRCANEAKEIVIAPKDHELGELVLSVTGSAEYEEARKRGDPWVHLLVAQRFETPPHLDELNEARLNISFRLQYSHNRHEGDYNPGIHAAQFLLFFTVQNLNRDSKGYGNYLYFGVPLYDNRHPEGKGHQNPDGAGKFIYSLKGSQYLPKSTHDGEWTHIDLDLLPLMFEALETAWGRGFLQESKDRHDYFISGMNMGWEVPGIFDVSGQVKDFSLKIR